jgi:hypothetical protein
MLAGPVPRPSPIVDPWLVTVHHQDGVNPVPAIGRRRAAAG